MAGEQIAVIRRQAHGVAFAQGSVDGVGVGQKLSGQGAQVKAACYLAGKVCVHRINRQAATAGADSIVCSALST